ncbi:MAG TPA: hypothetical protein VMV94_08025 [Phycisphaerae bacterium]|nr:hypothetical protein [Phycisphaerae bacterium]
MSKAWLCVGVLLFVAGCAAGSAQPGGYMSSEAYQARQGLAESLFPSDQAVLGTEAIEKILSSKITLPLKGRVAVLDFVPRRNWQWWSDDLLGAPAEAVDRLLDKLRSCERVADASILPSLLAPERCTVPYLREAAARYQADLLLIYRAKVYSSTKANFLAPDEVMAHCSIEAVLLDTRTGTVPFTAVVTSSCTTKQKKEDFDKAETLRRARLEAQADAFDKLGGKVVAFLDAVVGAAGQAAQREDVQRAGRTAAPAVGARYPTTGEE